MKVFPVYNSTISAEYLNLFLQEKYGFSSASNCKIFRTGINDTYFVHDLEDRYVFRIYSLNWRTEEEVKEEIRLLRLLKEGGISVSFPIEDLQHQYIQKIPAPEGGRLGVLFSFAHGAKVRNLTENTAYQIGLLMAKYHAKTENLHINRIDYNAHTLSELPYSYASKHFSEDNEEMKFVKRAGVMIDNEFKKASSKNLRKGVVHLDIWYDNMSIHNETDITLFDFDFCGNGYLVLDIAYFAMQLFHIEADKEVYESKLGAFLQGYRTKQAISKSELELIPYAGLSIWIFYLGIQSLRFDNWSNVFLSENYLIRYMGMSKNWLAYHDIKL